MKNLILILFIVGSTLNAVIAQNFRACMLSADSLIKAENYEAAAAKYEEGFKFREGVPYFYNNAALASAEIGDKEKAFSYLLASAKKGSDAVDFLKETPAFKSLQSDKQWKEVLSLTEQNLNKKLANQNIALTKKLERIYLKDQLFRGRALNQCIKNEMDSMELALLGDVMQQIDSTNLIEVKQLIEEHGWLGIDQVGDRGNTTLWLVLQHADVDTQEAFLPTLRESHAKGQSKGEHLALLTDRILMRRGKKQLYGSQLKRDSITNKMVLYPIKDIENVDARRKKLGMESMESYLSRWGLPFPPKAKVSEVEGNH